MTTDEKLDLILEQMVEMKQGIVDIQKRMDRIEKRMDAIEERMDAIEERMDAIEKRMDAIEERMDVMEKHIDGMEKHIDGMQKHIDSMEKHMNGMQKHIDGMQKRLGIVETCTRSLDTNVIDIRSKLGAVDIKVTSMQCTLENELRVNIKRVAEGHLDLARNLKEAMKPNQEVEVLSIKMRQMETDMKDMQKKIS